MYFTRYLRSQKQSITHIVDQYAQHSPTRLTMKQIIDFARKGNAQQSFQFLHRELPVRFASMMREMRYLPPRFLQMPSVKIVNQWYETSLAELHEFKDQPSKDDTVQKFTGVLHNIRKRLVTVVETLAQGYKEFSDSGSLTRPDNSQIQYFLNRFYLSRISIRLLIYQHTICFGDQVPEHPSFVGFVNPECYIADVIHEAFENARFLCENYYVKAPSLKLRSINTTNPGEPIFIAYIQAHLYHIMFELFKNAMRATVEYTESKQANSELPPVTVLMVKSQEDLTIRISDRGGGIPRSKVDKIFNYMYSTAPNPVALTDPQNQGPIPLAGFGFGLPISRLYARYLSGNMEIHSVDGYGTDAYIHLKVIDEHASEWLPICNRAAREYYKSRKYQSDWTGKKSH